MSIITEVIESTKAIIQGMGVTLSYIPKQKQTVEYPDEPVTVQPRYRGQHLLHVDELGRVTPKFKALRELFIQQLHVALPPIPADPAVIEIPPLNLTRQCALLDALDTASQARMERFEHRMPSREDEMAARERWMRGRER